MSTIRKAVTIFDEDAALTILKPFSGEYENQVIVIHEDAYGEAIMKLQPITELRKELNLDNEEFNEILKELKL